MGVYIPSMEMPRHCGECGIEWCNRWKNLIIAGMSIAKSRPSDCPLVPVPPHGELCDKTALVKKIGENIDKAKDRSYDWWYACTVAYDFALAAPTIIEAEEGER